MLYCHNHTFLIHRINGNFSLLADMAEKFAIAFFILLTASIASSHILIGRDLSQRKIFRTKTGGEFLVSKPLSLRQKRMVARELLRMGLADMVARKLRETSESGNPGVIDAFYYKLLQTAGVD